MDQGEVDLLRSAHRLAGHFMYRHAVPSWLYHEVHGDARLTVAQLWQRWDPERASWNTYLFGKGYYLLVDNMRQRSGRRWPDRNTAARPTPVPVDDLELSLRIPAQRDGSEDVVERLTQEARWRDVVRAFGYLSERQQYVLRRYYLDGAGLRVIGDELGVTESRACQLKKQGVRTLREVLVPAA